VALTDKGEVYTWGSNSHGQIGGISLSEIDNISKIDSKSAAEYIS
jgi:alpha-tubulin suppressor-like RCC1 family protein